MIFRRLKIQKDDIVIIFTDGLVEQIDLENKAFSNERLKRILKENCKKSLKEIKEILIREINFFKQNQNQKDDITFLLLKFK